MKATRVRAAINLVGGQISLYDGEIVYHDGQTPPTEEALETELARLQAEYDSQEYARNRASSYPSTGDQLDMIYKDMKNGTSTHADAVEVVKTKYPKG